MIVSPRGDSMKNCASIPRRSRCRRQRLWGLAAAAALKGCRRSVRVSLREEPYEVCDAVVYQDDCGQEGYHRENGERKVGQGHGQLMTEERVFVHSVSIRLRLTTVPGTFTFRGRPFRQFASSVGSGKMFVVTGLGGCLASTAALCACQACTCVSREMLRKSARLAYCTLFFAAVVLSWVLRDFAKPLIEKLPCASLAPE